MNSTTFEARLSAWLEDGPTNAPDEVLPTVLASVQSIPQRRDRLGRPWRSGPVRHPQGALAAVAAVIAITAGALIVLPRSSSPTGGGQSTAPSPSPGPARSPIATTWWDSPSVRSLGASFRIPPGWTVNPAPAPWEWQQSGGAALKLIASAIDPDRAALYIASQPMPADMTPSEWWASYLRADTGGMPAACFPTSQGGYRTMAVDGQTAYVHGGLAACSFTEAIVLAGGRAYQVTALANVDGSSGVFDPALFEAFLSTVRFEPASAGETPPPSRGAR
jgi:hypothetical protein